MHTGKGRKRVSDGRKVGGCSIYMGHRQRKIMDQRWRVLSEGCAGREGQRVRGNIKVELER